MSVSFLITKTIETHEDSSPDAVRRRELPHAHLYLHLRNSQERAQASGHSETQLCRNQKSFYVFYTSAQRLFGFRFKK